MHPNAFRKTAKDINDQHTYIDEFRGRNFQMKSITDVNNASQLNIYARLLKTDVKNKCKQ